MNYRWKFKYKDDNDTIQTLAKSLKIPRSLANVLTSRGFLEKKLAETYFAPTLDSLHSPFLMLDMEKAVDRVLKAKDNNEGIWVHGDYDVDGTSSTALVCQFMREIGIKCDYYIPDRFEDGYGLSIKSVDLGMKNGASVLITVDVGITSYEPLAYAKEKGVNAIICDHHEPGDFLPEHYALLDPLTPGDTYPFTGLSACGVAFKLIHGIAIKMGEPERAMKYLDLVAISSIADMVPLVDENRALVYHGLKLLNKNTRPGLRALINCTGIKKGTMNSSNIVFAIAPLINAAGRLGDAKRSVELLMQDDDLAAFRIAQELEDENRKRRLFDQQTFEEAIPIAQELLKDSKRRSLVVHKGDWHAGVIGIVASRLVDKFNVPSILLTNIDGVAKGSCRSVSDFDVHSALKKCDDLLIEYGGHRHAAGLSLKVGNIPELRRRFDELAQKHISKDMLIPEIDIDAELSFNELSPNFLNTLSKFAPFGYSNDKPMFYSKGVRSVNGVKLVGRNTIRFRAIQNNFEINAVGQNLGHKINMCTNGKKFSIVYNLEANGFNGQGAPQINIKDIKPDTDS